MKYRYLGKTGMKVSELCLGLMTFETGYSKNVTKEKAYAILDAYVDNGGNFFDMADNYPGVEEFFGGWLKNRNDRDLFVIASKVRFPNGTAGVNNAGLTRKHILQTIDQCLGKTGAGYIDLYQAHCWDDKTPIEETLSVFDELIKAGKIRYSGGSNFSGWHIAKTAAVSQSQGKAFFHSYQMQYNLLERSVELDVVPAALDCGATINAWSPLAAGWLSGKYRKDKRPPENSRMSNAAASDEEWSRVIKSDLSKQIPHPLKVADENSLTGEEQELKNKRRWMIIDAVRDVANAHGKSPAQIALAWLLTRPALCSVVIGVSKIDQLTDNLGAQDIVLEKNEADWLDGISAPVKSYPHDFIEKYGPWR